MAPQRIAYLMLLYLLSGKCYFLLPFLFAEMQEMLADLCSYKVQSRARTNTKIKMHTG